jgi:hypothetical protein
VDILSIQENETLKRFISFWFSDFHNSEESSEWYLRTKELSWIVSKSSISLSLKSLIQWEMYSRSVICRWFNRDQIKYSAILIGISIKKLNYRWSFLMTIQSGCDVIAAIRNHIIRSFRYWINKLVHYGYSCLSSLQPESDILEMINTHYIDLLLEFVWSGWEARKIIGILSRPIWLFSEHTSLNFERGFKIQRACLVMWRSDGNRKPPHDPGNSAHDHFTDGRRRAIVTIDRHTDTPISRWRWRCDPGQVFRPI